MQSNASAKGMVQAQAYLREKVSQWQDGIIRVEGTLIFSSWYNHWGIWKFAELLAMELKTEPMQ